MEIDIELKKAIGFATASLTLLTACHEPVMGAVLPPLPDPKITATSTPTVKSTNEGNIIIRVENSTPRTQMRVEDLEYYKSLLVDIFNTNRDPDFSSYVQTLRLPSNSLTPPNLTFIENQEKVTTFDNPIINDIRINQSLNLHLTPQTSTQPWKIGIYAVISKKPLIGENSDKISCYFNGKADLLEHSDDTHPQFDFSPTELMSISQKMFNHTPNTWDQFKVGNVTSILGRSQEGGHEYTYTLSSDGTANIYRQSPAFSLQP